MVAPPKNTQQLNSPSSLFFIPFLPPVALEVRILEFRDSSCRGSASSVLTRQLNTCQASQDNRAGLEYSCLKEGAAVMQLVCFDDKRCAGNSGRGSCSLNVYNPGQCIRSSSTGLFVNVVCAARGGGGGGGGGGVFVAPP